jgi:hypothetical protein
MSHTGPQIDPKGGGEAKQAEPVAWLVYQPRGSEFDYIVYADEGEAENDVADQGEDAEALPLYLHPPGDQP